MTPIHRIPLLLTIIAPINSPLIPFFQFHLLPPIFPRQAPPLSPIIYPLLPIPPLLNLPLFFKPTQQPLPPHDP
ncbi:DUF378 domain-containing protein, partial [Bacillus altitudinis]|uniref:DUF378 domain-containing protein n=1 Tax=Bacillus altitudinis TaxID=293387 RepID=UPI0011A74174